MGVVAVVSTEEAGSSAAVVCGDVDRAGADQTDRMTGATSRGVLPLLHRGHTQRRSGGTGPAGGVCAARGPPPRSRPTGAAVA